MTVFISPQPDIPLELCPTCVMNLAHEKQTMWLVSLQVVFYCIEILHGNVFLKLNPVFQSSGWGASFCMFEAPSNGFLNVISQFLSEKVSKKFHYMEAFGTPDSPFSLMALRAK